jgi:hypothetical protein
MRRIVTWSMAVLMTAGGAGFSLAETVEVARPARYVAHHAFSGRPVLVPPRYVRWMRMPPNPDAPAWSQLDPGLRYVGP